MELYAILARSILSLRLWARTGYEMELYAIMASIILSLRLLARALGKNLVNAFVS
jgi:hypothetical protein